MLKKYPLTIIWGGIIFGLSVLPGSEVEKLNLFEIDWFDKLGHFGCYGILAVLLGFEIKKQFNKPPFRFIFSRIFWSVFFLGFLIELIQGIFLPSRYFDITDILSNIMGGIAGAFLHKLFNKL